MTERPSICHRAALTLILSLATQGLSARETCEYAILKAASEYKIPVQILYAVGLTESGTRKGMQHLALNVAGRSVFPKSPDEALAVIRAERQRGVKLIDVGCMQINLHYHGANFSRVEEMLKPSRNVAYAARFLAELRTRHSTWTMAVARYHAGPFNDPAQKKYVCRVIRNVIAVGGGQWTPQARALCSS